MTNSILLVASRHSAFYTPLLGTIAGGFLAEQGLDGSYDVLRPGERSRDLLREGRADVMQSAVGSNFGPFNAGETDLPVHFAQINSRDGFFIAARKSGDRFQWKDLEGRRLLADHGGQPMLMLKYAAWDKGVRWDRVDVIDAGAPEDMIRAFRDGEGDFVHLQGPAPQQLEAEGLARVAAAVGEAMPPVAFSSLCATASFLETDRARDFSRAFRRSRAWAASAPPEEIAAREASLFPGIDEGVLVRTIARYQELGCWQGDITIALKLYEQAVEVFRSGGAIERAPAYQDVVREPPA